MLSRQTAVVTRTGEGLVRQGAADRRANRAIVRGADDETGSAAPPAFTKVPATPVCACSLASASRSKRAVRSVCSCRSCGGRGVNSPPARSRARYVRTRLTHEAAA